MDEDSIYEDYLHKLSDPSKAKLGFLKSAKWKEKYFILKKDGERPVLECYRKKPKPKQTQPKDRVVLWPTFKVEKLNNTHNRAFVLELTTPERHLYLSTEEQSALDMLVFLLQIQARLMPRVDEDTVVVYPDSSEALRRVGAQGARCLAHVCPWGVTLALESTRSVLIQWPLKSIRCYEATGHGQFVIEAGRVAPMGEGIYVFNTEPGADNQLYDLVDKYVVNTLDRPRLTRRGTTQEIEDFIQEADRLHSLTKVEAILASAPEIARILHLNWNHHVSNSAYIDPAEINGNGPSAIPATPATPPPPGMSRQTSASLSINSQLSRQVSTTSRGDMPGVNRSFSSSSGAGVGDFDHRVTSRPPPPPPRPSSSGSGGMVSPRQQQQPPQPQHRSGSKLRLKNTFSASGGIREIPGEEAYLPVVPTPSPSSSGASNPLTEVKDSKWSPPPTFREVALSDGGYDEADDETSDVTAGDDDFRRVSSKKKTPADPLNKKQAESESFPGERRGVGTSPRNISASCEELTDWKGPKGEEEHHPKFYSSSKSGSENEDEVDGGWASKEKLDENMNAEKIPVPFPRLQEFRHSADWDRRDRSHSVDYYNTVGHHRSSLSNTSSPTGPSARLIRRMVQSNNSGGGNGLNKELRKAVSNPNFLNLGSKEQLNCVKSPGKSGGGSFAKSAHTSRSLASLLMGSMRRNHSRESINRRSRSVTPDRFSRSRCDSMDKKSASKGDLRRQGSVKGTSIKGITITERSRSFRRVKKEQGEHGSAGGGGGGGGGKPPLPPSDSSSSRSSPTTFNNKSDASAAVRLPSGGVVYKPSPSSSSSVSTSTADSRIQFLNGSPTARPPYVGSRSVDGVTASYRSQPGGVGVSGTVKLSSPGVSPHRQTARAFIPVEQVQRQTSDSGFGQSVC